MAKNNNEENMPSIWSLLNLSINHPVLDIPNTADIRMKKVTVRKTSLLYHFFKVGGNADDVDGGYGTAGFWVLL